MRKKFIFFLSAVISGISITNRITNILYYFQLFQEVQFMLFLGYEITEKDVCQSQTNYLGLITRARPNGPVEIDTMGAYACSAYSDHSCCSNDENFEFYKIGFTFEKNFRLALVFFTY